MFWMIIGSVIAALAGLGIYIYCLRQGQFDDEEAIKYQLFREENPDN
jgi:cbb3-type cytochrome oxidase maturation protein